MSSTGADSFDESPAFNDGGRTQEFVSTTMIVSAFDEEEDQGEEEAYDCLYDVLQCRSREARAAIQQELDSHLAWTMQLEDLLLEPRQQHARNRGSAIPVGESQLPESDEHQIPGAYHEAPGCASVLSAYLEPSALSTPNEVEEEGIIASTSTLTGEAVSISAEVVPCQEESRKKVLDGRVIKSLPGLASRHLPIATPAKARTGPNASSPMTSGTNRLLTSRYQRHIRGNRERIKINKAMIETNAFLRGSISMRMEQKDRAKKQLARKRRAARKEAQRRRETSPDISLGEVDAGDLSPFFMSMTIIE